MHLFICLISWLVIGHPIAFLSLCLWAGPAELYPTQACLHLVELEPCMVQLLRLGIPVLCLVYLPLKPSPQVLNTGTLADLQNSGYPAAVSNTGQQHSSLHLAEFL